MTRTLTTERLKVLLDELKSWQYGYDPVDDKEQFDMLATAEWAVIELLANREAQPVAEKCNQEVYENGKSACLVAIPKEMAEVICRGISEATGCKVDWHYIGGRVHIKALAPPAPAVPEEAKLGEMPFLGKNERGYVRGWNDCRAAMLAQPVSGGYTLNSPVIPDGWIACSERMPASGGDKQTYVLAGDFKNHYWPSLPNTQVGVYGDWFNDGNPTWDDGDGNDLHLKEVTHWMPLPAAPEGGNG